MSAFSIRIATETDIPALVTLMDRSIAGPLADFLTPQQIAARIRAMYTAPELVRGGVGRLILRACEDAARAEGYDRVELVATMGGAPVPLVRMGKSLEDADFVGGT